MDTVQIIRCVCLFLLLVGSAFFSSAETAFVKVNRIKIQLLAEEGKKAAKRVDYILEHQNKMLSAILIGNNIVNISASALTTIIVINLFGNTYVGIATGILTIVVMMFGEILPKGIATSYSLRISLAYSGLIVVLMWVLTPVIFIVEKIRLGITKLLRLEDGESTMTEDVLKGYVDEGLETGAIESDEFEMIHNVFSLDEQLARDIMVPRIDIVFVPLDATRDELMEIYSQNQFTRYPVFNDKRDTVIGTINMKDLLSLPQDAEFSIGSIMRQPHFTFEHKEVGTLLMEMRDNAWSMAIVLDEYGATSGIVTMEDILEEIVGEIRDEYDNDERDSIRVLKEGEEYLTDGSTNLVDINEELGTKFESEEYDSIGGYMIQTLDRLPKSGESVELSDGTKLIAEVVHRNRVETVHIQLVKDGDKDKEQH